MAIKSYCRHNRVNKIVTQDENQSSIDQCTAFHHDSSCGTSWTAPEEDELIVVVPLVLNLDLKLNKQVGFDSVQMISPGRV